MATFDGSSCHEGLTKDAPLPDMSHEYTCFLCNGHQTVIGSVIVDSVGVILLNAIGITLEMNTYDQLVSVNETEPYSTHILILVFPQRYVMLSHIIRKNKLVQVFKDIGLYKEEPKLPLEAIGFYDPQIINDHSHTVDATGSLHLTLREHNVPHGTIFVRDHHHDDSPEEMYPTSHQYNDHDQWSNAKQQERHMQQEITQQSLLNPIQLLSSQDQARKSTVNSGDWMQLQKYPSNTNHHTVHNKTVTSHCSKQHSTVHNTANTSDQLQQLINIFPDHTKEQLQTALIKCGYNIEDTINTLLLN